MSLIKGRYHLREALNNKKMYIMGDREKLKI